MIQHTNAASISEKAINAIAVYKPESSGAMSVLPKRLKMISDIGIQAHRMQPPVLWPDHRQRTLLCAQKKKSGDEKDKQCEKLPQGITSGIGRHW